MNKIGENEFSSDFTLVTQFIGITNWTRLWTCHGNAYPDKKLRNSCSVITEWLRVRGSILIKE